ncbi:putative 1-phosphatidylinositol-3-phosphate 5-kinase FAB1C [Nymphaea colorata]|nr:putative 1-phosphatidylinositol-3-phosphate 5-kinase FAB1C [Nymphaea colorata]
MNDSSFHLYGYLDSSLSHLFEKVRSWLNLKSDLADCSGNTCTCHEVYNTCFECNLPCVAFNHGRRCCVCGRPFCAGCMQNSTVSLKNCKSEIRLGNMQFTTTLCKLCLRGLEQDGHVKQTENDTLMNASENSLHSSFSFSETTGVTTLGGDSEVARLCGAEECKNGLACKPDNANGIGNVVHERNCSLNILSPADQLPPVSLRCYDKTYDAETCDCTDPDDTENFSTPRCEYYRFISDIDASSTYTISDVCSFKSATSTPFDNSSFTGLSPEKVDSPVPDCQLEYEKSQGYFHLHQKQVQTSGRSRKNVEEIESPACSVDYDSQNQQQKFLLVLDYKNNDKFWLPPEDENEETENTVFESDDEFSGTTDLQFSSNSVGDDIVKKKDKLNEQHKESLRAVIHGHFRALISQLLKGEGIDAGSGKIEDGWVEIVTSLAWQSANFVKPDTNDGGSMDPCDYVKVKCIACGYPRESVLIKGVVFSKKMKHKRMTSRYKNPKLLLLGALEYEKLPNQLASIDTLINQEMDDIKMKVSKIQAHHPNVVLVEKSVSPRAIEHLLSKDISLVLNVKRSVLERIARTTGAQIIPSVDDLISPMLGQCEIFRLETFEEYQATDTPNKKPAKKTLMFLEGCPRRLGCTVLLRGAPREELKKVKHVVQYAVFAAYHLLLETSFLADEGATLPNFPVEPPTALPEKPLNVNRTNSISRSNAYIGTVQAVDRIQASSSLSELTIPIPKLEVQAQNTWTSSFNSEHEILQLPHECAESSFMFASSPTALDSKTDRDMDMTVPPGGPEAFVSHVMPSSCLESQCEKVKDLLVHSSHDAIMTGMPKEIWAAEEGGLDIASKNDSSGERMKMNAIEGENLSQEFIPRVETKQGIAVLFSRRCLTKGTVCEQSQLLRIKFYGISDKPLGRFLQDDLFNQASPCMSCSQPAEAHVRRYIHEQGSVSMYVKCIPSLNLPGKPEGKIWMWHRCLKCARKDGVSEAKNRVIMSDAAWGLSFGKFLELSFSDNATAKRVASCSHSLQRDCLHYYGYGDTVAFFCYDPIDIFTVFLPSLLLEYRSQVQQEWITKEAADVSEKMKILYTEVFDALQRMEEQYTTVGPGSESMSLNDFINYMAELKILIRAEKSEYDSLLRGAAIENCCQVVSGASIFELAYLRWCLLVDSYVWDHRLHTLDSLVKTTRSPTKFDLGIQCISSSASNSCTEADTSLRDGAFAPLHNGNSPKFCSALDKFFGFQENLLLNHDSSDVDVFDYVRSTEGSPYTEDPQSDSCHLTEASESMSLECSILSENIDVAWTGSTESLSGLNTQVSPSEDAEKFGSISRANQIVSDRCRKAMAPVRVYSFDSVLRFGERSRRSLFHTSPGLSPAKSFHVSGDCDSLVKTPVPNMRKFYYRGLPKTSQRFDAILNYTPSFLTSSYHMLSEGPSLLLPSTGRNNIVVAVYDNEPTSIITYALSSKEYESFIYDKSIHVDGSKPVDENNLAHSQINYQIGSDDIQLRSYGSDASALSPRRLYCSDSPKSPHFKMSFDGDSLLPGGKVRFAVTCYFAKHFDGLRRKCSPNEIDFLQSLSRCRRWRAQGGKSNVYFAKTLDERFIIKQVTRTELASFEEFALYYFKYLSDALSSGYPTCLAKVLGIYQVTTKYLKTGKEEKMDFMVMENLFFGRTISRTYDLKGSTRSRYNADNSEVLLDENFLEVLRTNPIFLRSEDKHCLERAVWNDTSFLTSVDVMDYSLLVGVDEERKELVLGIIDFMRQYTWDKHLETWAKTAGILRGQNSEPTVISPKQYKKRFRRAIASYFLMVPEQ